MSKKYRYQVTLNLTEISASDEPWGEKELAKRLKEYLIWHNIAGEAFCNLVKVNVTLL